MSRDIKERCKQLLELLKEYSDCWTCGEVIKDSSLLVPDPFNPGLFRSSCPKCNTETTKCYFPPKALRIVFDMIVESAELNRPILVLVLSCTVFEAMVEGLVFRLLERRHTYPEICEAIVDATEYHSKMRIIHSLTGEKLRSLATTAGYDKLLGTLEEIKHKRNSFLHTGVAMKVEMVESKIDKLFTFPQHKELDVEDIKQALEFTIDTVHCFAKVYSEFGKYVYIDEPDY